MHTANYIPLTILTLSTYLSQEVGRGSAERLFTGAHWHHSSSAHQLLLAL